MEPARSWFSEAPIRGKYIPGAIIKTSQPVPREWKIDKIINEHDEQLSRDDCVPEDDLLSFATIRVRCFRVDKPDAKADMRVYLQVPYKNTERESAQLRGNQQTSFQPRELKAYKLMSAHREISKFTPNLLGYEEGRQSERGLVPMGFETTVVWERVPGHRLGLIGTIPTSPFWQFSEPERDDIRGIFKDQLILMGQLGVMQAEPDLRSLVFHQRTQTLYWVGFYDADLKKRNGPWTNRWYGIFGLLKPPPWDNSWTKPDWSEDIRGWGR
ncbi:hypothetical protein N7456_000989 [Penicillium angulare]|uniref:Uncharacterized protein n=1 Tax=Penicillium angulare TaxID=116970 RepID=A0A9W9KSV5_9EURO|nr:hypothetical protein N7456_000989 [Penicillium angulare]